MTELLQDNPVLSAAYRLLLATASLNVLASVLTIALIFYMRNQKVLRITMYLEMVIAMTVFQALYDVSFFTSLLCVCNTFGVIFFTVTGVTASMWSLLIICSVGWVISYKKVPPANFVRFCWGIIVVVFISVFLAIEECMRADNMHAALNVYNISRLTIIVITFLQVMALYLSIYRRSGDSIQRDPLYHLVRKLMWYPIVQMIARLGGSTYDLVYHRSPFTYSRGSSFEESITETILLYMFMIFTPSAGIGCAVVFCTIQKGAWICLKRMVFPWVDYGPLPADLLMQNSGRQSMQMHVAARGVGGADEDQAERLALLDEEELTYEVAYKRESIGGSGGSGGEPPGEVGSDHTATASPMCDRLPATRELEHPL